MQKVSLPVQSLAPATHGDNCTLEIYCTFPPINGYRPPPPVCQCIGGPSSFSDGERESSDHSVQRVVPNWWWVKFVFTQKNIEIILGRKATCCRRRMLTRNPVFGRVQQLANIKKLTWLFNTSFYQASLMTFYEYDKLLYLLSSPNFLCFHKHQIILLNLGKFTCMWTLYPMDIIVLWKKKLSLQWYGPWLVSSPLIFYLSWPSTPIQSHWSARLLMGCLRACLIPTAY